MTDAERYNAHLRLALEGAAKHAPNPTQHAAKWLRWLKAEAPRGEGVEPGWGGESPYIQVDKSATRERHIQIIALRREGMTYAQIAVEVNLSESRVAHVCAEHGVRPQATATCRS